MHEYQLLPRRSVQLAVDSDAALAIALIEGDPVRLDVLAAGECEPIPVTKIREAKGEDEDRDGLADGAPARKNFKTFYRDQDEETRRRRDVVRVEIGVERVGDPEEREGERDPGEAALAQSEDE